MSKIVRAAKTSHTLSLFAMEEASRVGQRTADLEHLFLALAMSEEPAGQVLRSLGIDLDRARRAVDEQRAAHLESLGVEAAFPAPGPIVFHETDGYEWSKRASDLITRAAQGDNAGDAASVLRELVDEPSGHIADILARLGTTPLAVTQALDGIEPTPSPAPRTATSKDRVEASTEAFVPADIEKVWALLADPARVPIWEMTISSVEPSDQEFAPGATWQAATPATDADGKPTGVRPEFQRSTLELVAVQPRETIAWRTTFPDTTRNQSTVTEFSLTPTPGGTQVRITKSWTRAQGWRRIAKLPLRPLQKLFVGIHLNQVGNAIGREFR